MFILALGRADRNLMSFDLKVSINKRTEDINIQNHSFDISLSFRLYSLPYKGWPLRLMSSKFGVYSTAYPLKTMLLACAISSSELYSSVDFFRVIGFEMSCHARR
jgi:hypothetical protein